MTKIQDVTGTAFIVAEYRARENGETNPLYRDPIVPLFLNERTRQVADRMAGDFPAGGKAVRLRTRYYDDHLDAHSSRLPAGRHPRRRPRYPRFCLNVESEVKRT